MLARAEIISGLATLLGESGVLTGADVSDRFDGWPPIAPVHAHCIARPASTEEVSSVLQYCNDQGIAVVPQGGRTGLSKGARSVSDNVVLSTERLNRIESVDEFGSTMTVQAGVALSTLQTAAYDVGLFYPVDIGARGSATIGGMVATNAGGNRVLRYGMTREQVLGIEVVLADGTVVSNMNRLLKNNAGYDIKQLFIGSEGTLGVVTRAVLRLRPPMGPSATAFISIDRLELVQKVLRRINDLASSTLTSFEVMWPGFLELVLAHSNHTKPLSDADQFCVLVEIAGSHADAMLGDCVSKSWEEGLVSDAVIAKNEREAAALWAIRDDAGARAAAMKPNLHFDIGLPQNEMDAYISGLRKDLESTWPAAKLLVFGHLADCNLHLNISVGTEDAVARRCVDEMVYRPLAKFQGTVAAEHGIGLSKRDYLGVSRNAPEIALMRRLKALLDPKDTMNPGKIFAARL